MKLKLEKCMNSMVYKEPYQKVQQQYLRIDQLAKQMEQAVQKRVKELNMQFSKEVTKLDALSPLKTLSRGYCVAEWEGKIMTHAKELQSNMEINLRFQDGEAKAKII